MNESRNTKRYVILGIIVLALAGVLLLRLFVMQTFQNGEYEAKVASQTSVTKVLPAARGEILDRSGNVLATNRVCYDVQLNRGTLSSSKQNDVLLLLLDLLDEDTLNYTDTLPISEYPYEYLSGATEEEQKKYDSRISYMLKTFNLARGTTAEKAMAKIKSTYGLKKYSEADARRLAGLRYDMTKTGFTRKRPYTIAKDVGDDIVAILSENIDGVYTGAEIAVSTVRYYPTGTLAHTLGTIGKIPEEKLEEYLEKGYEADDLVGRDGIELTAEEWLHGTDGYITYTTALDGTVTVLEEVKPVNGNNLYLTIDLELQTVGEETLAATVEQIVAKSKNRSDRYGYDCNAGSFVVLNAKTAEVLAIASFPDYDLNTYYSDYNRLLQDENLPLFNRAIAGVYAPGSTFKMCTALAALKSGAITTETVITCTSVYSRFSKTYYCWVHDNGTQHGSLTVTGGLKHSCNVFFYEAGYRTGITNIAYWADRFGLGKKTGIELQGEKSGVVATPAYAATKGEVWTDGQTITAAIGQSYNAFTPIQIANYVATVVNGGYRHQVSILYRVKDYQNSMTLWQNETKLLDDLQIEKEYYQAIINGMDEVTNVGGTAYSIFRDFPVAMGGKTGTASVGKGTPTGVFVCCAPIDDPQIVVAVVIEHGVSGGSVAPVAKAILEQWVAQQ